MKAYTLKEYEFDYPDDMEKILDYLHSHGELHISPKEVERAYREYSDDVWCAGWISVNDNTLWEFANWLSERDDDDESDYGGW